MVEAHDEEDEAEHVLEENEASLTSWRPSTRKQSQDDHRKAAQSRSGPGVLAKTSVI